MINKIIGYSVLLISFIGGWAWMEYQSSLNDAVVNNTQVFEIEKGDTFNRIASKLVEQHVAIKPLWFKVIARHRNLTHKLKAGEYQLSAGLTIPDLLSMFAKGKTRQYAITFPEGWTYKQVKYALKQNQYLAQTLEGMDDKAILAQLGAKFNHPEGLFFPDTYFFEKGASDYSLLQRAFEKMQKTLQLEWQQRTADLPLKSAYEALILASIVEKETGVVSERRLIAGVFIRRLRKKMLLQTDPTVIYGMGDKYQGNIRTRDLKKMTPYNTYRIKGLPPTPIAMPGQDAIHSVLHPDESKSLYFVSKGNGHHIFSSTLKDHNHAVDVYQRKIKAK